MAKRTGGFIGQDGINAPDQATGVSASGGDTQATVSFTSPSDVGGAAITGYRVQSNDGIGASGSASPITVSGLSNGTSYTFNVWAINPFGWSSPSDASAGVTPAFTRGLLGNNQSSISRITYIDISTLGNGADFGDRSVPYSNAGCCSSETRAVLGGGEDDPSGTMFNTMDYVTIASIGNATDFGDLTVARSDLTAGANSTRGIWIAGGKDGGTEYNTMDYATIASTGNATDFGDYNVTLVKTTACTNATRLLSFGGRNGSSLVNDIRYLTIATTGNTSDFGDTSTTMGYGAAVSSGTRAVVAFGRGSSIGSNVNTMEYVAIASTGNSVDFGDLTGTSAAITATCSTTRGVFKGDFQLDYITIASTGNAADFGNALGYNGNMSNGIMSSAHGGLS